MRFIPDGPSIPDELLTARDAGQVLFFCGAGVSQAEAGLPNFAKLAEDVLMLLGSALDSPARRLLDATRKFEKETCLTGLVATDRIFGMLEREFEIAEVREAVAIALKPKPNHSLSAHQILLDLSRNRAGVPRLVTTNFDLLFEDCEAGIASFNPPRLPEPHRDVDFRGIIHLHGRVDTDYRKACDDEFVLSSADFGRAYLSDGWATRYIQALLQRFQIVFVGYSADDLPVQYLLEALNRFDKPGRALYAFQAGDAKWAGDQWAHKGVKPIVYDNANGHRILWDTLSAWAERARDVDGWHDRLIARAAKEGPELMMPNERGMIAHLASTTIGARFLATAQTPLPANWLCVIDHNIRYAKPNKIDIYDKMSASFDPFKAFGLDSDVPPLFDDQGNSLSKREVPRGAWDVLASISTDQLNLPIEAVVQLRGSGADKAPNLPQRFLYLGMWIVKIAHQPIALWWAAQQAMLHPQIQNWINWSLRNEATRYTPIVRKGWRMLFAYWQQRTINPIFDRYAIDEKAKLEGWSASIVQETIALYRPILSLQILQPSYAKILNLDPTRLTLNDIVQFDVEYPHLPEPPDIPSDMLGYAVTLFSQQLEYAVQLESQIKGNDKLYCYITRSDDGCTLSETSDSLTGHLVTFSNMMVRLTAIDRNTARREAARWSGMNNDLFIRLRIWSGGRTDLTTPEEAGQIFLDLDDEKFWSSKHERDLLFALRDRWSEIPSSQITRLEARLCEGNFPWAEQHGYSDKEIACCRLNRLHWLATKGVTFSFDYEGKVAMLRTTAPEWTTEYAVKYTAPLHLQTARTSIVCRLETDSSSTPLENLPIEKILEAAATLSQYNFDSKVRRRPFDGLVKDRPARALSAITDAARKGKFVPWAWSTLLSSESDKAKSPRMLLIIGHRLARLSPSQLAEIACSASLWLYDQGEQLFSKYPQIFNLVWSSMIAALTEIPDLSRSPHSDRRWVYEGLNRPAGRMANALLKDPAKTNFQPSTGLPENWKLWLNQLLGLPDDYRRHAIAMIMPNLNWLFRIDPDWVSKQLLPLAIDEGDDGRAFWAGYFWGGKTPQTSLYQHLKPRLIAFARQENLPPDHANILADILLTGWGRGKESNGSEQLIQDVELREILIHAGDDLRTRMLWHFQSYLLDPETETLWGKHLVPFLTQVWPRQRNARTARISGRLADMALAISDRFPEIVQAILPRLVPIMGASLTTNNLLNNTEGSIIRNHPQVLLTLLQAILPENRNDWPPYASKEILDQLAQQSETKDDPRLAELRQREQQW